MSAQFPATPILADLRPGDHLLYNIQNFFDDPFGFAVDAAIRVKTWSTVAHIEIYDVDGMSLASRASGVNRYPFRAHGLRVVLRPQTWNHNRGVYWFQNFARGQKYDWLGLLCFTLAVKQGSPNKQFCSEFARNLGRASESRAFAAYCPGDKVAPGSYLMVGDFEMIYNAT